MKPPQDILAGLGRSDLILALGLERKKCEELEARVELLTKQIHDIHYFIGKRESHGLTGDVKCILEWIANAKSPEEPFV